MKILLGSCTKHNREDFEKTPTYNSMLHGFLHGKGDNHEFYEGVILQRMFTDAVIKTNNKENIGKHYNKVLEMAIDEQYDTVILMHDDVQMDDLGWTYKLNEAFKEYDVVGLAGAKHIELKQPALWHLNVTTT